MNRASQDTRKKILSELSVKFLLIACSFAAALFVFVLIAHEAVLEKEDIFDQKVFAFLQKHTSGSAIKIMQFFTFFGSMAFLIPAYALLIAYLLIVGKKRNAINVSIIGISSTLLMFLLKWIFRRNRPELPLIRSLKTFSFPSGHALSSFIFCSIIIYLIWQSRLQTVTKWVFSVFLFLFSMMIGLSRIVLKVHYATDVIAGFCLGFAWVLFSFWLLKWIEWRTAIKA